MLYANRMFQLPRSRAQQFVQLFVVAGLTFSLGLAASRVGRDAAPTQPATIAQPARSQAVRTEAAPARVPYEVGWELYDNGWAGGPAPQTVTRKAPAISRVPYEAGWELYDGGWAGGPAARVVTRNASARVLYEAGWELYDNGWAGGPRTVPRR